MRAGAALAPLAFAAALAGCAGAERAQTAPASAASEERIAQSPWLVSSEYFRERRAAQPPREARAAQGAPGPLAGGAGAAAAPPGYVVRVSGRRIYTDLAGAAGVAPGASLSILAERELVHPATGRALGRAFEEIARANVVEVAAQFSIAEIVELQPGETVKPNDRVALRRP